MNRFDYDIAVIGGGLAGLGLAIQCAGEGYRVALYEKEKYPFHKVCGEYISFESWDFLEELGVPLSEMNLPVIRKLQVSAPNGKLIEHMLPLGGFGISRFKLDSILAGIAKRKGVQVFEGTKVDDVTFAEATFKIGSQAGEHSALVVAGAFGKRSNLDVKWKRDFITRKNGKLNNYIGVKYHVRMQRPPDTIELHNFSNGYCGISRIEDDNNCLCYLTTAQNLKMAGNSIPEMEKKLLRRNPHLDEIFSECQFLFDHPVTISQISFESKELVQDHVLMVGDAAGMIAPLCGNGMSMALHACKLAFEQVDLFLKNKISRYQMEEDYKLNWRRQFNRRLGTGRFIQRFFGSPYLSNFLVSSLKPFPYLVSKLISATHGKPF